MSFNGNICYTRIKTGWTAAYIYSLVAFPIRSGATTLVFIFAYSRVFCEPQVTYQVVGPGMVFFISLWLAVSKYYVNIGMIQYVFDILYVEVD